MLTRLQEHRVVKPWGRTDIPSRFGEAPAEGPLGEIWFQRDNGATEDPLLVKYLFTSERLSVQVHPDDEGARRAGLPRGKDEGWIVLDAQPGAAIGIGLKKALSGDELRDAALDGSIVDLVDWRQVAEGDRFYSPAGTVHAIGAGLTVLEIQQNSDVTYRLYDYGRPRELHLDESVEAARTELNISRSPGRPLSAGREAIVEGEKFVIERWSSAAQERLDASADEPLWLIPLRGRSVVGEQLLEAPGVWIAEGAIAPEIEAGSELLIAYPGSEIRSLR